MNGRLNNLFRDDEKQIFEKNSHTLNISWHVKYFKYNNDTRSRQHVVEHVPYEIGNPVEERIEANEKL